MFKKIGVALLVWCSFAQVGLAHPGEDNQGGPSKPCERGDCEEESPKCEGVSEFDIYPGNSHRAMRDLEVWRGVGEHQLVFIRYHNSRIKDDGVVINPQFGSAGQWRHAYQWEMVAASSTDFTIFYPDGTRNTFHPVGAANLHQLRPSEIVSFKMETTSFCKEPMDFVIALRS